MWKAVKTGTGKIGVGEAEGGRSKERSRAEERREGYKEETEKRENNGGKESGGGMGNEEEEAARSEEEAKKLVPKEFHRWTKVFSKKQLEQMPMRKA